MTHLYGWGGDRDDRNLAVGHTSSFQSHLGHGSSGPPRQAHSAPSLGAPPPPPPRHAQASSSQHAPGANPSRLQTAAWSSIGGTTGNGGLDKQSASSSRLEDRSSSFSDKRVEFMLKCAALKDNEFKPGGAASGPSSSPSPVPLDLIHRTNNGDMVNASDLQIHGAGLIPQRVRNQPYDTRRPQLRAAQQNGPTNQRFTPSATRCLIKHNELEAQSYEQGTGKAYPFRSPLDWSEHTARGHHGRKMNQKRPMGMLGGHGGLGPPLSGSIYLGGGPHVKC